MILAIVKRTKLYKNAEKSFPFYCNMPKLTDTQNAVLNIMDYLFIQDVESLASFNEAKNSLNADLLSIIDHINSVRRNYGKKAELYKHYVLCGLELMLNLPFEIEDSFDECNLNKSKFILDRIIHSVLQNSFDEDEFLDDMNNLFRHFESLKLDKGTIYKLVRQCLYFDCDNVAISAYKKFIDIELLNTQQYNASLSKVDINFIETSFFRSMLLVEFDILKRQFDVEIEFKNKKIELDLNKSLEEIESIFSAIKLIKKLQLKANSGFQTILDVDTKNRREVEKYIVSLSEALGHETLFFKNIPACIGLMGCWFMIKSKETNLDSPMYYELFDEKIKKSSKKYPNDNKAREIIAKYGFDIRKRTLNSRYIGFYDYYDKVRTLFKF